MHERKRAAAHSAYGSLGHFLQQHEVTKPARPFVIFGVNVERAIRARFLLLSTAEAKARINFVLSSRHSLAPLI